MHSLVDLLKDSKGNDVKESVEVNIEEFKSALSQVDSQMKNLPATAQVASQQGVYLANCFNRMKEVETNPEGPLRFRGEGRHRFRPFRYRHVGQFAHLGGEQTAAQLPGDWVSIGQSTQWLWYSVYASKQVSWRTRALVVSDWIRCFIFGRDSSNLRGSKASFSAFIYSTAFDGNFAINLSQIFLPIVLSNLVSIVLEQRH
ncbi:external alternative NAD(P)H-ubiquinone oxidoreductase B2, mitochondrial-like [Coffea eugenioides]|uniref:external alternative NAD(P)H-ubiquinone oxidoreductase B2, mitochondrial-like n=1 Tax=Coffea eugenioides TaxID=49369 RepID=UPI000F606647|nr:external alternative NAD(P)H-ubiquinone oxidoreductase B2, mitochondrial-like [Coffea eugenioides]